MLKKKKKATSSPIEPSRNQQHVSKMYFRTEMTTRQNKMWFSICTFKAVLLKCSKESTYLYFVIIPVSK